MPLPEFRGTCGRRPRPRPCALAAYLRRGHADGSPVRSPRAALSREFLPGRRERHAPISRGSGAEPVWFEMWCRPCRAPGVTTGGHVVRMVRGAAPSWFGVARSVASFDLLALRRRSAREQGPEFRLVGQRARIVRDRLDHPPRPSRRERPRRPCRAFGSRDQRARRAACYSVGWGVPGARHPRADGVPCGTRGGNDQTVDRALSRRAGRGHDPRPPGDGGASLRVARSGGR